jgi:hypothetical protein
MLLPPSKATLKKEAACSSETFVSTYDTTCCDNPEDHNLTTASYMPVSISQIAKFHIIHNIVANP